MSSLYLAVFLLASVVASIVAQRSVAIAVLLTTTFCLYAALRAIRRGQVSGPIILCTALVYGVMPQLAVAYFGDVLERNIPDLPFDLIPVTQLSTFINLSLMLTGLLLPLASISSGSSGSARGVTTPSKGEKAPGSAAFVKFLTTMVCLVAITVVAFILATQYSRLSYSSTVSDGFGRLGGYAIGFVPIVALTTWAVGSLSRGLRRSIFRVVALGAAALVSVLAVRAGDRGPLLSLTLGATLYLTWPASKRSSPGGAWTSSYRASPLARSAVVIAMLLGGASLLLNVRATRGSEASDVSASLLNPVLAFGDFSLEDVVYQDWATPALMLGMSMTDTFVSPGMVLETSVRNLPGVGIVAGTTSIGERLARRYDPVTSIGYGDYVYRDSYTTAGWFGLPLIPLALVLFSRLLDLVFARFSIRPFLAAGITGVLAFQLVRSQMSFAVHVLVLGVLVAVGIVSTLAPRSTTDTNG